jgi:hypothetical protein
MKHQLLTLNIEMRLMFGGTTSTLSGTLPINYQVFKGSRELGAARVPRVAYFLQLGRIADYRSSVNLGPPGLVYCQNVAHLI